MSRLHWGSNGGLGRRCLRLWLASCWRHACRWRRSHLRGFRDQLRTRRDLLLSSLAEHAPTATVDVVPAGGLNLWARLPEGTAVDAVVRECESRGLVISPGAEWFPAEPSGAYVRLNYAHADPARFSEAAEILGGVLAAS